MQDGIGSATALWDSVRASGILEDCVCFSCLILKAPNSLPPLTVIRGAKGLKRSAMGCFSPVSVHTHTGTYDPVEAVTSNNHPIILTSRLVLLLLVEVDNTDFHTLICIFTCTQTCPHTETHVHKDTVILTEKTVNTCSFSQKRVTDFLSSLLLLSNC